MLSRASLEEAYRREEEPRVRERLMLVLRVRIDGATAAQAAREARRSKGWASYWLERIDAEGIDGLKDKKRSGRPPELEPRVELKVRRTLREERQDKSRPHYKSRKVRLYLRRNRSTIRVRWFPTSSPELNVMEECWSQAEKDLLASRYYPSSLLLKRTIATYLRTKRFRLDMLKFLLRKEC